MNSKPKLLFLCTGNSCRSQMAEGFAKSIHGNLFDVYSAGIENHGLNSLAVKVMKEIGIDISNHKSKITNELPKIHFDFVITVCDHAKENCPYFPGSVLIHKNFEDPPLLAKNAKTEEDALIHYRKVRNQIKSFVKSLDKLLD